MMALNRELIVIDLVWVLQAKKRREQRRARIKSEHAKALATAEETMMARMDEISKKMCASYAISQSRR